MSKRNKQQMMYQPQTSRQAKRRPVAKGAASNKARAGGKSAAAKSGGQSAAARSLPRAEQTAAPRLPVWASLMTIRIAAVVIAVAALAGGVAWALSTKPPYAPGLIIGLILLGLLAGLGIALAVRTEEIVARVAKWMPRNR